MARQVSLPGPARGPWQVTFESGRNVVVAQSSWTTVLQHPSGWRTEYDEADRVGVLIAPTGDPVHTIEVPPGTPDVLGRLIEIATDWATLHASERGLPSLE
jgi:hypothetical protein